MWASGLNWRPIVRGTSCAEITHHGSTTSISAFEDGSIVFDWRWPGPFEDKQKNLEMKWFSATFGNLLLAIERMRLAAKSSVEYAAEVHVVTCAERFARGPYWTNWHGHSTYFEPSTTMLGRYPVSASNSFAELSKLFDTDVCNLAGAESPDSINFNYDEQISAMRQEFGLS